MKALIVVLFSLLAIAGISADTLGGLVTSAHYRVGETDSSTYFAPDSVWYVWMDLAQNKYIELNGYIPRSVDIIYSEDSAQFRLPATFKKSLGLIVWSNDRWQTVLRNQFFLIDTSVTTWFIGWKGADTADLYADKLLYDGDTLRLFYEGVATAMTAAGDNCDLPDKLEVFVIDEAILMYEQARRAYAVQQALWQQARTEQGIVEVKKE